MKKTFVILVFVALSAFLLSKTTMNIFSLNSAISTEFVVDFFIQIDNNCDEDGFTNNGITSFGLKLKDYYRNTLFINTLYGMTLIVWQPPKKLIY
jgi:hypothetical protein